MRKPLDLLRPDLKNLVTSKQEMQIKNYSGKRIDQFFEGDVILARDFRKNYSDWSEAKIIQKLSPHNFLIKFNEGEGVHKRHCNQIKPWRQRDINISAKNKESKIAQKPIDVRRSNRQIKPVQRYCANVHYIIL